MGIGLTIVEAHVDEGFSEKTYYNWVKGDRSLAQEFGRLRQYPILKARQTIVDSFGETQDSR